MIDKWGALAAGIAAAAFLGAGAEGQFRRPAPQPPAGAPKVVGGGPAVPVPGPSRVDELVGATARAIETHAPGRPRVALFAFGDANGGTPEALKPQLDYLTTWFAESLADAGKNRFAVVGPDGIRAELKARGKLGNDASPVVPDAPKAVGAWLTTNLPDVAVALIGRLTKDGDGRLGSVVTLVTRDGKATEVRPQGFWAPPEAETPPVGPNTACAIRPELFVHVKDQAEPRRVPLHAQKEWRYAHAVLPDDLVPFLDGKSSTLEIRLTKTTAPAPEEAVDAGVIYKLADTKSRLYAAAVSIDGVSTIAEPVSDFQKDAGRPMYRRLPPEKQRKWILSYPGFVAAAVGRDGTPVVTPVSGPGHSVRPVLGFQADDENAQLFTLRRPSDGAAPTMGLTANPGLIRVTVFAQRVPGDKEFARTTVTGSGIPIEPGAQIQHKVTTMRVACYPTPVEEHVILLCTKAEHDPQRENLAPYPPAPVTK